MTDFLRLMLPDDARTLLLSHMEPLGDSWDIVDTGGVLHRVNAEDLLAPHALPEFARSTVDGYAVRATDTFGASDSLPAYLRLSGEVTMGTAPSIELQEGQCCLIHTGGMLPSGTDAIVMLEHAQTIRRDNAAAQPSGSSGMALGQQPLGSPQHPMQEIEVMRAVAPGENVIRVGEDVARGQLALSKGVRIGPAAIGGLMALGITTVRVYRKPRVAVISSGDEVVDPRKKPGLGQVRDVNASALAALVREAGGEPITYGIVPDDFDRARALADAALAASDALIVTAGSSASTRDLTARIISSLGLPGVLVHGINIRPGKPTILGVCAGKAVIGLPGNPVSALIIAHLFVRPAIELLLGLPQGAPRPSLWARLSVNLASQAGREDWWPVRLSRAEGFDVEWRAEPVFGKSNLIFNLVAADGMLRIPAVRNGLDAGELVEVVLL